MSEKEELSELDKRVIGIAIEQCNFENPAHGEIVGLAMVQLRDEMACYMPEFLKALKDEFGQEHKLTATIKVNTKGDKAVVTTSIGFDTGGKVKDERTDIGSTMLKDDGQPQLPLNREEEPDGEPEAQTEGDPLMPNGESEED